MKEVHEMDRDVEKEIKKLNDKIEYMKKEKADLCRYINDYCILSNNKDKYILTLEGNQMMLEEQIRQLTAELDAYKNRKSEKLRVFIEKVLRRIKRELKRILGKA